MTFSKNCRQLADWGSFKC